MTYTDAHGNRQRAIRLTFGAWLIICHNADGTRRYYQAGRTTRINEWTRAQARRYARRYVNQQAVAFSTMAGAGA